MEILPSPLEMLLLLSCIPYRDSGRCWEFLVFWKQTGIYMVEHLEFDLIHAPLYLKWAVLIFPALESIIMSVSRRGKKTLIAWIASSK